VEALIFAAGEGRRLRPITERTPKALIDVGGRTALERVFAALVAAGVDHVVVNAHHFAVLVEEAALSLARPGVRVSVSREDREAPVPLETGGGLAFARDLLDGEEAFFLHNADVLTDLDLADVYEEHRRAGATDGRLATLVVTRRETSRPLLVDTHGVYGRKNRSEGWEVVCRHPDADSAAEVGFAGIHVVSPAILRHFRSSGTYSIIDVYMRLVAAGEVIGCYDATGRTWYDIGTPERLERANAAFGDRERD
jgi:MurNAc alpha-1-phosphate uridylyltransferase